MSRKPRKYTESGVYHIILRGNDQQIIFCEEKDREFFLNRLKKYAVQLQIDIYAYCLMSNHVHLLLGNATKFLSKFVQKLANSYVYYFNRKYERSGHLFQGRFKSETVDSDEYLKTVWRYILKNPELAGIESMESYKWSSYHETFFESANGEKVVNSEYIFSFFSDRSDALEFVSLEISGNMCMEYKNKKVFSDEKCIKMIKAICGLENPFYLKGIPIGELHSKLGKLKALGMSCNQISRLTGVSRGIIRLA